MVVVRDGPLHLLPFEAFMGPHGRYLAQAAVVSYAPSVTSFHLLSREIVNQQSRTMLGVGGVGYARSGMNSAGIARGNERFTLFRTAIFRRRNSSGSKCSKER